MACEFKIGDLVWARIKGFPAWPGKVIEPKQDVKRPADKKKNYLFIFFLGSENYAWVPEDAIWTYVENKERFTPTQRVPRGFKEAVDAMEELLKHSPPSQPARPPEERELSTASDDAPASAKRKSVSEKTKSKPLKPEKRSLAAAAGSSSHRSSSPPPAKQRALDNKQRAESASEDDQPRPAISDFDAALCTPSTSRGGATALKKDDTKTATSSVFMPDVLPSSSTDAGSWSHHVSVTPLKIGFLGLGTIGSAIVGNLLKSGHEVTVWNRTHSKCREFVKEGASQGSTACEVVQSCDITFSCISDPTAVRDLVFGNCGVLQGISESKAYVDMSTVDVETMTDVCEAVTARGGRFLEAPVVGNKQLAIGGQLIVLAAGDKTVFDECASCFQAIGKQTFYLGEMGLATRMKLVLNMLVGTTLAGLAESLALAGKLGLNINDVLEVLSHSSASSQFIREKGADIVASRYQVAGCKLSLLQKDLKLAINMSDVVDQPLHVGSAVNELFKKAKAKGYGDHDISAVFHAANL